MSYSDLYRDAMEKATPCDAWKSETIEKMKSIQTSGKQNKATGYPHFNIRKFPLIPAAWAALVALMFFCHTNDFLSSSLFSDVNTPSTITFSSDSVSAQVRTAPIAQSRNIAIFPNIIEAETPQQALPSNSCSLDDAVISTEQYDQTVALLETQLMEQSQDGTLPIVLTKSDIVAQGYFSANDTISVVFVLPATSLGKNLYYVYEIPLM